MMSRYMEYGAAADPLQRTRAAARAMRPAHPHALQKGLLAVAPRLALVVLAAGVVQALMHWAGN
ncbi:hypothetical protein [Rhizobium sp. ICMP 5592]|uniref:hypothetical protein n=1 Tax=Rhizobium sp. ICMP 5592 TaxID=2292445 RepID=UPI00188683AA|nr:hypothetical protein [Rhizobium sp. ICMP 5592]MQB43303.1 hypothetical protein [Rhizobium sp. ICMP 5592]